MHLDIKELKKKIKDHFESISDEELKQNLINAGLDTYKDVELNFLQEDDRRTSAYQAMAVVAAGNEANSVSVRVWKIPAQIYVVSTVSGLVDISDYPVINKALGGIVVGGVIERSCRIDAVGANSSSSTENSLLREVCL